MDDDTPHPPSGHSGFEEVKRLERPKARHLRPLEGGTPDV